jgi:tetratricopeptide (TPR) repeat protein
LEVNGSWSNYQVSLAEIGGVYFVQGQYLKAISYYERALGPAPQPGDRLSVSKWLRNLADAYGRLGSAPLAKRFESEAQIICDAPAEERKRAAHVASALK